MVLIRKYGVWLALLLTLAATVWVSKQESADKNVVALNVDRKIPRTKNNAEQGKQDHQPMTMDADSFMPRSPDNDVPKNIFTPFVAIQNNPGLNAASANTSPANPFVYAGKIIEDGELVVFLIEGEKSHAVRSGDVIEDTWKIKSITPPTMILKYLPLKVEIQMEIGANS
jgi:hypothetical protein